MLTRTNAPGVDHVAHKDPTIADLTRVGNFQDDIPHGSVRYHARYDTQTSRCPTVTTLLSHPQTLSYG